MVLHTIGEIDDTKSTETNDGHLRIDKTLNERTLTTQQHVSASNDHPSETPICLVQSTAEPTKQAITIANDQGIGIPEQSYGPPNIKKQPNRYRRARMLSDLATGRCPLVQAGEGKQQRSYPIVEVLFTC